MRNRESFLPERTCPVSSAFYSSRISLYIRFSVEDEGVKKNLGFIYLCVCDPGFQV